MAFVVAAPAIVTISPVARPTVEGTRTVTTDDPFVVSRGLFPRRIGAEGFIYLKNGPVVT